MSATMSIKYIDTLEYVQKAKELQDPEALAQYQVKKIESAIELGVQQAVNEAQKVREEFHSNDFATKSDMALLRTELQNDILRYFIRGMFAFGGGMLALVGVMAKGFQWI